MTLSPSLKTNIVYPDTDRAPMAESDLARDYLIYGVEALQLYFQNRDNVYVSGNMFIYYQKGVPDAVVAPDVFVIFGVSNHKRLSWKVWQEGSSSTAGGGFSLVGYGFERRASGSGIEYSCCTSAKEL